MLDKPFHNDNGITIAQLKAIVKDLPEKNEHGDEYEVWIGTPSGFSNVCTCISALNKKYEGSDIILES